LSLAPSQSCMPLDARHSSASFQAQADASIQSTQSLTHLLQTRHADPLRAQRGGAVQSFTSTRSICWHSLFDTSIGTQPINLILLLRFVLCIRLRSKRRIKADPFLLASPRHAAEASFVRSFLLQVKSASFSTRRTISNKCWMIEETCLFDETVSEFVKS